MCMDTHSLRLAGAICRASLTLIQAERKVIPHIIFPVFS